MCAGVEVWPISDTFAMGLPEVEILGDFARLTWSVEDEEMGRAFRRVVAKIIVGIENVPKSWYGPASAVLEFKPRLVV
jgi:hypothetical protein